jgi:hypothetical protein
VDSQYVTNMCLHELPRLHLGYPAYREGVDCSRQEVSYVVLPNTHARFSVYSKSSVSPTLHLLSAPINWVAAASASPQLSCDRMSRKICMKLLGLARAGGGGVGLQEWQLFPLSLISIKSLSLSM